MTRITRETAVELCESTGVAIDYIDARNICQAAIDWAAKQQGEVVITRRLGESAILAVTRQDEEGRILSIIAEADTHPVNQEHGELVRRLRRNVEGWLDDKPEELMTLAADALEGKL